MTEAHRKSRIQERRITKSIQEAGMEARRQLASGSLWFAKSDVVSDLFQIEAKTKVKPSKSMTIKKQWLDKIALEAFENSKIPLLAISFGDGMDYYVIEDREFLALVEEIVELRGGSSDGKGFTTCGRGEGQENP